MATNKIGRRQMLLALLLAPASMAPASMVKASAEEKIYSRNNFIGVVVDLDRIEGSHSKEPFKLPNGAFIREAPTTGPRFALAIRYKGKEKRFTASEIWEALSGA